MTRKLIVKQIFEALTMLMPYEENETIRSIEKNVIKLFCDINGIADAAEECENEINAAKIISTEADAVLFANNPSKVRSYAVDIKAELLSANKINILKTFDWEIFVSELEDAAFFGQKNACELLACLNWIGIETLNDKEKAKNIWETLAVNGDEMSLIALIYACNQCSATEESLRWQHIFALLEHAEIEFLPVIYKAESIECSEKEIELANIILFMRRIDFSGERKTIDRAMIYYIMHSNDDYLTKMFRLSSEKDFYSIILEEGKGKGKRFGF